MVMMGGWGEGMGDVAWGAWKLKNRVWGGGKSIPSVRQGLFLMQGCPPFPETD